MREDPGSRGLRARILVLGACAVLAQTVFVREILGLVSSSELVIGLFLSSWMLWVAAGSMSGGRMFRPEGRGASIAFPALAGSAAALVPSTVIAIRLARSALARPPGVMPDLIPALTVVFLVSAPFGAVYGFLYNISSMLLSAKNGRIGTGIRKTYVLETAGSLAGAVVFAGALALHLTQMENAFLLAFAVTGTFAASARRMRAAAVLLWAGAAASAIAWTPALDRWSISLVFEGYEVERIVPSMYGELCLAGDDEVMTVFSGGRRLLSIPEPERAEEAVHPALLSHPDPSKVLLAGGALGGGASEALEHSAVDTLHWIELDGKLVELASGLESGYGARRDRSDAVTRALLGDARMHIARSGERYDVIIVNAPEPVSVMWNRYFTVEFFEEAAGALRPGGVLSVSHASSENFISDRQAAVLSMVRRTMEEVFPAVTVLPGGTAHFIGSHSSVDPRSLLERLESRGLENTFISMDRLPYRLTEERLEYMESASGGGESEPVNRDLHPGLVLRELALETSERSTAAGRTIAGLEGAGRLTFPAAMIVAAVVLMALSRSAMPGRAGVFIVGFAGMTLQMSIMLVYQSWAGVLYHMLVLLSAVFLAGLSAGAAFGWTRLIAPRRFLRLVHGCFVLLAAAVPATAVSAIRGRFPAELVPWIYVAFSGTAGLLAGAYYRTVVRECWKLTSRRTPGIFYAWDLLGGSLGALIAGALLIPLSGITLSAALVAALHVAAALILAGRQAGA